MATWKKIVVSGSAISQLNNDSSYLVSGDSNINLSGSFSGSFQGDGSSLTGVVAQAANALTDGAGIVDFSYDGNTAGVTVSVDSGSLAGNGISTSGGKFVVNADNTTGGNNKPVEVGTNGVSFDIGSIDGAGIGTSGGELIVNVDDSTIEINSDSLRVKDLGIATGKIANDAVTTAKIAHSLGEMGTHAFTGSFSGSFTGTTDLPDLTDGNGIADFTYDGSSAASIAVQADSTTGGNTKPVSVGANGVGFDISTIDGAGIGTSAGELIVNVDDSSIEINSDSLRVKASGVTNSMLVNDSVTIGSTEIDLGTTATSIAGLTLTGASASGSFSGSFEGDGSSLTGIATTLSIQGDSGTDTVNLQTGTLDFEGTSNEIVTSVSDDKVTFALPDDVTIGQDLTVTRDLVVSRNLTVSGTASFQHTEDLDVADRFIRMASGSTANGDGGIVIQQTSATDGEVFGFDSANTRFGVAGSFDASQNAFTPTAFMSAVVEGSSNDPNDAPARYDKKGNIFIATNEDIYIYS